MMKHNKGKLILSSAAILLPALIGAIFWNELPAQMTTHWGADGIADGWSGKAFAVFGLPLIILALHWVCVFFTVKDAKNKHQNRKVFGMVLWISPILSCYASAIVYADAFGKELDMEVMTLVLIGFLFVLLGNYMPKCTQNLTIGIKVKWALANEENWNATHRFGGKVYVIGGLLLMLCIFLPSAVFLWALILLLTAILLAPVIYSYVYYRKQVKAGTAPEKVTVPMGKWSRLLTAVILVAVAAMLAVLLFISLTGDIEVRYNDTSFTVEASYWEDITVAYADIESIEYRGACEVGSRTNGFGTPRLSMGTFQNEEFGRYTRYSYTGHDACVILRVDGKVLVLGGRESERTWEIYERILENMK